MPTPWLPRAWIYQVLVMSYYPPSNPETRVARTRGACEVNVPTPPKEVWYRYEDVQYAAPLNEFDVPVGQGQLVVVLREYEVVRHTAKGVWVCLWSGKHRFVLRDATKTFTCPTRTAALKSFIARKRRQASIYKARLDRAQRSIAMAERMGQLA